MQRNMNVLLDEIEQAISVNELKNLLTAMVVDGRKISIRYRLVGETWQSGFKKVLARQGDVVMLLDEASNTAINVVVSEIMQFETDCRIGAYTPGNHYDVFLF